MDSRPKGPVMRKALPCHDVIRWFCVDISWSILWESGSFGGDRYFEIFNHVPKSLIDTVTQYSKSDIMRNVKLIVLFQNRWGSFRVETETILYFILHYYAS